MKASATTRSALTGPARSGANTTDTAHWLPKGSTTLSHPLPSITNWSADAPVTVTAVIGSVPGEVFVSVRIWASVRVPASAAGKTRASALSRWLNTGTVAL